MGGVIVDVGMLSHTVSRYLLYIHRIVLETDPVILSQRLAVKVRLATALSASHLIYIFLVSIRPSVFQFLPLFSACLLFYMIKLPSAYVLCVQLGHICCFMLYFPFFLLLYSFSFSFSVPYSWSYHID